MKKFLSIILLLTLLLSMSVTAFATDEGSTTVSVDVPAPKYDYKVHIPADCKIEYGNTEPQYIGTVEVTSDYWDNITTTYLGVLVECRSDEYLSNKNGADSIFCAIGTIDSQSIFDPFPSNQTAWGFKADGAEPAGLSNLYIEVPSWSKAKAGESYSVTITYTSKLADRY